jgi:ABC-2 type transport system ATP-binding protein
MPAAAAAASVGVMNEATPALEVDKLRLRYGEVTALDDLTFALAGGKVHGLLGRNGAGKTSLLSVLAAFRKPTAGTVRIGGQPVFENPRVTRQVCLVGETGGPADTGDSVKETLSIAQRLRPAWDADYAAALVERFGLPLRGKLGALSLGQRSALGITVGLAARAPLTMFDEPHLGMDAPSRQRFRDELQADLRAHPRTVIVSTHLAEELSPLFAEVVVIDNGRLVAHEQAGLRRPPGEPG